MTHEHRWSCQERGALVRLIVLLLLLWGATLSSARGEAADNVTEPPQVGQLLKLLADPTVRTWLEEELKKRPINEHQTTAQEVSWTRLACDWLADTRARLDRLGAAVPRLPQEFRNAAANLAKELQNHSPLGIVALVLGFALLGRGAEWAFRRATNGARVRAEHAPLDTLVHRLRATAVRFAFELTAIAVFALGSIGAFLVLDWPPTLKEIVLAYLVATLASRVVVLVSRLMFEPGISGIGATDRLVPMGDE